MGSRKACQTGVGCRLQEAWVLLAGENLSLRPRGQTLNLPVSHVPQCDVKVTLLRHRWRTSTSRWPCEEDERSCVASAEVTGTHEKSKAQG